MPVSKVAWRKELQDLVGTAKTPQEKVALGAFQKALGPYLENPELLRTLLSKIQATIGPDEVGVVVAQGEFRSLADLEKKLPRDIKVVKL